MVDFCALSALPLGGGRAGGRATSVLRLLGRRRLPQTNNMAAPESGEQASQLEFSLQVPFQSARQAAVALRSLSPDREPRRGGVRKRLTLAGSVLSAKWRAEQARVLRVSVNSFLEHLDLVLETMRAFPADVGQDPHSVLGRPPSMDTRGPAFMENFSEPMLRS
ncbi:cancer/testis antigen 1-like isoform 1-T1 [Syngnathus typhle]